MTNKYFFILIILLFCVIPVFSSEVLLSEIYFHPDSERIKDNSISELKTILKVMKKNKDYIVTLKGFTNDTGNPVAELELSKKRANRIALHLKDNSVSLSRVKTGGFGAANLKERKITEKNRRVEVYIFKNEKDIREDLKVKDETRKIKIKVVNKDNINIYTKVIIKKTKYNKLKKDQEFNFISPKVIDIPVGDNIECQISSFGYKSKKIIIKKNEEDKLIILNKKDEEESTLVFLGKATFVMGNTFKTNQPDENPAHMVSLNEYYISRYEVTQAEWNEVMDYNPSEYVGDDIPVHNISWYEAIEYCNKRSIEEGLTPAYNIDKMKKDPNNKNKKDKLKWTVTCNFNANGYRLPTEAEWEYAARGGSKSIGYKYSGSNDVVELSSTFNKYRQNEIKSEGYGGGKIIMKKIDNFYSIGQKKPNELGLFDMTGSVFEWCWDWYDKNYYKLKENDNPKGAVSGMEKIIRGGFFIKHSVNITRRKKTAPNSINTIYEKITIYGDKEEIEEYTSFIGLRVVRSVK